jgi:hypothetical protein
VGNAAARNYTFGALINGVVNSDSSGGRAGRTQATQTPKTVASSGAAAAPHP